MRLYTGVWGLYRVIIGAYLGLSRVKQAVRRVI